jgi:hypothetical protein
MTAVGKSCPIERERDLAHWVLKLTVSQAAIPTYGRFLRQFGRAIDMSGVAHEKRGSMSELGPCVDGSGLARAFFTFCRIGRCSHVSGLLTRFM